MTDNNDPSLLRDIASGTTAEDRFDRLVAHFVRLTTDVVQLTGDVHTLKGNLAANTSITKDVAEGQAQLKASVDKIDLTALTEFLEAMGSMKGGIKVLGWLERPAKWVAAIGGAIAVYYAPWWHK
jgi:hypothetical protein